MSYRLLAKIRYSLFFRQVAILLSGTAIGQGIILLSMPLVTRIYSPDEMGVMSLMMSHLSVWIPIACFRYDSAILIARSDDEVASLMLLAVTVASLMGVVGYCLLICFVRYNLFQFGLIPDNAVVLLAMTALLGGLFAAFRGYRLRMADYTVISKAVVCKCMFQSVARISFGLLNWSIVGLIAAECLAVMFSTLLILPKRTIKFISLSLIRIKLALSTSFQVGIKYLKFPKLELPSVFIDQVSINAPIPILASLYGAKAAGLYGVTRLMILIPYGQVGKAVGDVTQSRIAEHVRNNDVSLVRRDFGILLRRLAAVGLFPMIAVMILAPPFMGELFGKAWADAGIIAAIIAPWLYCAFVVGALSRLISVLQRQELKLLYDISALLLVIISWGAAYFFQLNMNQTICLISASGILGYVFYLWLLVKAIREMEK